MKNVIPATIAIKDGICRVGLSMEEISDLALAGKEKRAFKCSTRDLPIFMSKHFDRAHEEFQIKADSDRDFISSLKPIWGATTVASTMYIAHLAGINTFVTGGTGGVHRGGETTMDISADITELAQTPVVVVSAGIKSILDIQRTLESLETHGVPTVSYRTDEFPAFFSKRSGVISPARLDSSREVALAYLANRHLGRQAGMLVAVPNEDPAGDAVENAIQEALHEATEKNIKGRDVTPYVLNFVANKTGGESLKSNISLVKQNALVGSDIAIAISNEIKKANVNTEIFNFRHSQFSPKCILKKKSKGNYFDSSVSEKSSRVIVIGGAVIDLVAKPNSDSDLILGTSNPGSYIECDGGVGRNVAEVLGRLGKEPILYSAVGNDSRGKAILSRLEEDCKVKGVEYGVRIVDDMNTATYLALLDSHGDLHTAIADMNVLNQIPSPDFNLLRNADIIVFDANPPIEILIKTAECAVKMGVKVCFEPTSVPKASIIPDTFLSCLTYTLPNIDELYAMSKYDQSINKVEENDSDTISNIKLATSDLLKKMHPDGAFVIVTMGANGVLLASKDDRNTLYQHFPAEEGIDVQNSTGAGDTLCGAFVGALLDGHDEVKAVKIGMNAALKSVMCPNKTISPFIK